MDFRPMNQSSDSRIKMKNMKERNFLRRLDLFPGMDLESGIDCTLKLGLPYDHQPKSSSSSSSSSAVLNQEINQLQQQQRIAPDFLQTNFFSPSSQNYGIMMNGRGANAYNGCGINGSNSQSWTPEMMTPNNNMNDFGFFGASSVAGAPTDLNITSSLGPYPGFSMPQINVPSNDIYQRNPQQEWPTQQEPDGSLKRCTICGTANTPLWRNGPRGAKSVCNACGIRFKKEERRALGITSTNSRPRKAERHPRN